MTMKYPMDELLENHVLLGGSWGSLEPQFRDGMDHAYLKITWDEIMDLTYNSVHYFVDVPPTVISRIEDTTYFGEMMASQPRVFDRKEPSIHERERYEKSFADTVRVPVFGETGGSSKPRFEDNMNHNNLRLMKLTYNGVHYFANVSPKAIARPEPSTFDRPESSIHERERHEKSFVDIVRAPMFKPDAPMRLEPHPICECHSYGDRRTMSHLPILESPSQPFVCMRYLIVQEEET